MILIRILIVLLSYPPSYPIWWLLGSWLIWLLIKRTPLPRLSLPTMLIYSIAVAIGFMKSLREFEVPCFEFCIRDFSWPGFLVDVAFWFIVLYTFMKWIARIERAGKDMNWHDIDTDVTAQ